MATTNGRIPSLCEICQTEKRTVKCEGCSKDFCFAHMVEHHQQLSEQLGQTEDEYNHFKNAIEERRSEPENHSFMQEIDQWEVQSIERIQRVAAKTRLQVSCCIKETTIDLNLQWTCLTEKLARCRKADDFADNDVQFFDEELQKLKKLLNTPQNFKIEYTPSFFISKIRLTGGVPSQPAPNVDINTQWTQNAVTVAGGNGGGEELNQLLTPRGVYVDNDDHTVYIPDYNNHRVMAWKPNESNGQVVAGGNGRGNRADQLSNPTDVILDRETDSLIISDFGNGRVVRWPRQNGTCGETLISDVGCYGLTMDDDGSLYVVDHNKDEVKRYRTAEIDGTVVAGGSKQGDRLDQLFCPTYAFVDRDQSVYVSDWNNHRVMKWMKNSKQGIVVAGGHGAGTGLTQLTQPCGVVVDGKGSVYVADCLNHRIMRWRENAQQGSVIIGDHGEGNQSNQLSYPTGLSLDREGNLYVSDYKNHRVQRFAIDRI